MPIGSADELLYLAAHAPTEANYFSEVNGVRYKGVKSTKNPEHKVDSKVLIANGGREALAHSMGVLNADGEGQIVMYVQSMTPFLAQIQAINPLADLKENEFVLRTFVEDSLGNVIHEHTSRRVRILYWVVSETKTDGTEPATATFTIKSLQENDNKLFSVGKLANSVIP
jgi:hypothetical protein